MVDFSRLVYKSSSWKLQIFAITRFQSFIGMDDDYGKDYQQADNSCEKDGGFPLSPMDRLFVHAVSDRADER